MSCYHKVKLKIEELLEFLEPHLPLATNAMVNYFSKSLYGSCLDERLRKEISELGEGSTLNLIFSDKISPQESPRLHDFLRKTKRFSASSNCLQLREFEEQLSGLGGARVSAVKVEKFMSSKKSHEVTALAALIAALSNVCKITHVIDIGDGKGYLSSLLALHHEIPVLGVDSSTVKTKSAEKRLVKLRKAWSGLGLPKTDRKLDSSKYKRLTLFVDENVNFGNAINEAFLTVESDLKLGLIGLHTCGNLAPTSLRLFCGDENIKILCNVACCYHLLDDSGGFPVSDFLRARFFSLERDVKMLACQSVDRIFFEKKLIKPTLFYRAILQTVLKDFRPAVEKKVGKLRQDCDGFENYARIAFDKLGLDLGLSDGDLSELLEKYAGDFDAMNVYHLLRCSLAPVVENLVLLDRLLYLHERGFENAFLVRLFDPVISPRCYGLIAMK